MQGNNPPDRSKRSSQSSSQGSYQGDSQGSAKNGAKAGSKRSSKKRSTSRPKNAAKGSSRNQPRSQRSKQARQPQRLQPTQLNQRSQPAQQPSQLADTGTTFADLGLSDPIVRALRAEGLTHPFPIQAAAIPQALEGRDVLGRGPTGSGKTFTFGLPIIQKLAQGASKPRRPRGVVLVPTRELAAQVRERLEPLANTMGQRVLEVIGGVKIQRNITALARPVDILIATPGRAQDLLNNKELSFDDVTIVALDEADQMADMGFLPQVTKLLNAMPPRAQHLLFSATLDGDVQVLVDKFMHDPVTHSTGEAEATVDSMTHFLAVAQDREDRSRTVIDLGSLGVKTVMFMRTKHAVDRQVKKLTRAGITAVGLHGNKGQGSRTSTMENFASGKASVLVATDIAARGIDIKGVELVVHIDPPAEHKAYVHRAGRTARAGASGTVVTLTFTESESDTLTMMRKAGVEPTVVPAHDIAAVVARDIRA